VRGNFKYFCLEIMPHCSAARLHFRIIPAGSNTPLEFLTGFIDGGGSEAFGKQGLDDPLQRERLTGNGHGSDRRDTDRKEKGGTLDNRHQTSDLRQLTSAVYGLMSDLQTMKGDGLKNRKNRDK
jgi:hypothetical protein